MTASLLQSTSRISASVRTFITCFDSFFGWMVPAYLSQVAVLAHHLLLLLRESQVVKESVPDHLKAPHCHLQSIFKAPWWAADRGSQNQRRPPRRLWHHILGWLIASPWTRSSETLFCKSCCKAGSGDISWSHHNYHIFPNFPGLQFVDELSLPFDFKFSFGFRHNLGTFSS